MVIIGGGFGGLCAARGLAGAPVSVTLIDKRDYHLFRPMLYQVATGLLSADQISRPQFLSYKNDSLGQRDHFPDAASFAHWQNFSAAGLSFPFRVMIPTVTRFGSGVRRTHLIRSLKA